MDKLPRVEVLIGDSRKPPECPHGPTLLFKRIVDDEERLFYACSTCRDRKDCRFFLWADEELSDTKKKFWELEKQKVLPKIQHSKLYIKLMKISQSSINRIYCHKCAELIGVEELSKHSGHDLTSNLTDYQLTHPSEVLKALENPKKEAQYLFSKQSTKTIVGSLQNLGVKHVLCIGAPRIHEYILSELNETSTKMDSLLLDVDSRYHNFHGPLQFGWFNVFNNHFFNGTTSAQVVSDFLQQDSGNDFAIVIDPPFGGRVEPLADTIQKIMEQHRSLNSLAASNIKLMWIFPYFMEPHVLSSLPGLKMLDYKVDYINHPLFKLGPKGRKFGSPVRIFTNVSPQKIQLPSDEGYTYCIPCKRWCSAENKHCYKCSSCPSKDGRTYTHCKACKRCVKPSWSHCEECKRCCQQSHKCGAFQPSDLCYHCSETGHKKVDCPNITKKGGLKRKLENTEESEEVSKGLKAQKNGIDNAVKVVKKNKKKNNKKREANKKMKLEITEEKVEVVARVQKNGVNNSVKQVRKEKNNKQKPNKKMKKKIQV